MDDDSHAYDTSLAAALADLLDPRVLVWNAEVGVEVVPHPLHHVPLSGLGLPRALLHVSEDALVDLDAVLRLCSEESNTVREEGYTPHENELDVPLILDESQSAGNVVHNIGAQRTPNRNARHFKMESDREFLDNPVTFETAVGLLALARVPMGKMWAPSSSDEFQTLHRRDKDVTIGKQSKGYIYYATQVPKDARICWKVRRVNEELSFPADVRSDAFLRSFVHPVTPERAGQSKRRWDGLIKKWRKELYRWEVLESV